MRKKENVVVKWKRIQDQAETEGDAKIKFKGVESMDLAMFLWKTQLVALSAIRSVPILVKSTSILIGRPIHLAKSLYSPTLLAAGCGLMTEVCPMR